MNSFSTQTQSLIAQAFTDKDAAAASDQAVTTAQTTLAAAQDGLTHAQTDNSSAHTKAAASKQAALSAITAELG